MKSTFSRTFSTIVITLIAAFLAIGISFQLLVKNYLTKQVVGELRTNGEIIAQLVRSAYSNEPLSGRDFHIAISVAASVSGADTVICDENGQLLMCSDSPLGCEHRGLVLDKSYLERVFRSGGYTDTGVIQELYSDKRFIAAIPIYAEGTNRPMGIVIVSSPTAEVSAVMVTSAQPPEGMVWLMVRMLAA